jgi:hypothetical protein
LRWKMKKNHLNGVDIQDQAIKIGIAICLLYVLAACSSLVPLQTTAVTGKTLQIEITPTSKTPRVAITAWTAEEHGKLIQNNNCLQLQSSDIKNRIYTLFWPRDFSVTVDGENVKVVSGKITGIHKEVILHIGENLVLGGGTVDQLSEEDQKINPVQCTGPYWVVGEVVSHSP